MKSTGEVLGIDDDFGMAFAKAHMSSSLDLPLSGKVFLSVVDRDKKYMPAIARDLRDLGFELVATPGTKKHLDAAGIQGVQEIQKIAHGGRSITDLLWEGGVKLVINTPTGRGRQLDEAKNRELTIQLAVPCITTIPAARAAVSGVRALKQRDFDVRSLQEYFPK